MLKLTISSSLILEVFNLDINIYVSLKPELVAEKLKLWTAQQKYMNKLGKRYLN